MMRAIDFDDPVYKKQMMKESRMHGTFNTMQIMDRTGHSSITWDPDKAVEVGVARDSFDKLIKEGYRAFRVEGHDNQGERIKTFDPKAGKIMMVPHLVGG